MEIIYTDKLLHPALAPSINRVDVPTAPPQTFYFDKTVNSNKHFAITVTAHSKDELDSPSRKPFGDLLSAFLAIEPFTMVRIVSVESLFHPLATQTRR